MEEHELEQRREEELTNLMMADLEFKLQTAMKIQHNDLICGQYLVENRQRLLPRMVSSATSRNEDVTDVVAQFISGVHKRHQEGLPLS